jgi:AraC-like DNA-binding protein
MQALGDLDRMGRGGAIALLCVWGWIMLRDHRSELPARATIALIISVICHLIADMFPWERHNSFGLFLLKTGQSLTPACFWLFAKTWFDDERRIDLKTGIWIGVAIIGSLALMTIHSHYGGFTLWSDTLQRIFWLSYTVAGLWVAWRGRAGDLVEARRNLRGRFVFATGFYVLLVTVTGFIANFEEGPSILFGIVSLGIPLLVAAMCIAMFGIRQRDLFAAPTAPISNDRPMDDAQIRLNERLSMHMDHNKPHRDEGLTIAALASQLGEQEYRLRRLINGHLGYRNFSAFVGDYRLAEVKAALADPAQKDVPILTIALDAGFGSLGPFNRAFREMEGMTPSAFRALAAAD